MNVIKDLFVIKGRVFYVGECFFGYIDFGLFLLGLFFIVFLEIGVV